MEKTNVEIIEAGLSSKYHVRAKYVLLICEDCGKTWGCTPDENGLIPERQLVCRNCASNEWFEQRKQAE